MAYADGIEFEIIRKRMKCIRLRVRKDCSVVLSMPYGYSDREAEEFVFKNAEWIRKQQEKMASKIVRYEDGETIRILGEPMTLRISLGGECSCRFRSGIVEMTVDSDDKDTKERTLRRMHFEIVAKYLDVYVPKWEAVTGKKCTSYDVKYFKSRWGVCNVKNGNIRFNTELATKPPGCIDYVVLHEITHLEVPNHGAEFKRLMSERMPDWKVWERKLRS